MINSLLNDKYVIDRWRFPWCINTNMDDTFSNDCLVLKEKTTKIIKVPGFNKDNLEITFNKDPAGLMIYVKGENKELNISIDKKYIINYSNAVPISAKIKDGLLTIELEPEPEEERGYKKIPIE